MRENLRKARKEKRNKIAGTFFYSGNREILSGG